jgi:hypothetical protein
MFFIKGSSTMELAVILVPLLERLIEHNPLLLMFLVAMSVVAFSLFIVYQLVVVAFFKKKHMTLQL